MAASVELGDSLEELEELLLKDIIACEQALSRSAVGRAGRGRGTKKTPRCNFRPKRCKCLNAVEKSYSTLTAGRLFAFFRPAAIYLKTLTASVTMYKIVPCRRQKYNTRSSAMGNYYVRESRLSLYSFANFGTRIWNSLHPDWRLLAKRPFKKRIRKFLLTVLGTEDAYVDAYSLITKLNNH